ncbi:AMP-binding protein, partial [Pseudonocardia sp. RS11V-5]|uniref:AMP-binding protein n=1 Tax=Pseudonocardia terrae TaxID=2905831 RepID=UPI001E38FB57
MSITQSGQHGPQAPGRPDVPLSELVVVDRHEAQGWRVRRHERLDSVFEERCDWIREYGRAGQLAVDAPGVSLTYDELDARANRLARYLRLHGAEAGDRIALLFDDRVEAYVALLAVLKIGATCVPLDPDAPADRLAFVVADTAARIVLSRSHLRSRVTAPEALGTGTAEVLAVDDAAALIAEMSPARLQPAERGGLADRPAYVVHVADPSGWSEGVTLDHRAVGNAVRIASETFGLRGHRLYQGRALFSGGGIEEVWMAWAAGATLVPAPGGPALRGPALHAELEGRRVTALCTTPALLSTLERDLPGLRFLLVSGEPCAPGLVARWHRPGRRLLTAYVPPGASVTAAWAEAHPDEPVMIGTPLPTYATVVLDPEFPLALPHGQTGELGVAGLGLACGYLDSGDAFVGDFLGIPGNPSGRIYRTGDLGRVDTEGKIEYRGRIALQVLVGGERIDLTAVESVMLGARGVASAVVVAHGAPDRPELVGYYTRRSDGPVDEQEIRSLLRERLAPGHVPARLERIDALPLTADGLVDRAALPALPAPPSGTEMSVLRAENARLSEELEELEQLLPPFPTEPPAAEVLTPDQILRPAEPPVPPAPAPEVLTLDQILAAPTAPAPVRTPTPTAPAPTPAPTPAPAPTTPAGGLAAALAGVLAEVLAVEHVPVDAHVFDDLGADSMVMTRFCAR